MSQMSFLARIRCPVHLVAADSSLGAAMEPQDVARAVAMMPHCTHIVVKGAGHDIHLDQPQAFLQELRWFLQDIGVADTISGSEPKSRCPIQG
ncbi:MAG: hypothetical protein KatS3mg050_2402 [Litorilinea sp.]|nr:MAG: hypothetical protein KatS3mg050_2402 [Litorilinea sp.]